MSFLYPRIIAVHRPNGQTGIGAQPYAGRARAGETVVVSGLPASIQFRASAKPNPVGLPTDVEVANYKIFCRQLDNGVVQKGDIIVDDLETRYQVLAPYWDSLGANLYVKQLEV